jgi:hypothetical protein
MFFFLSVAFLAGGLDSADAGVYAPNGGCSSPVAPILDAKASPHLAYIDQELFYCSSQNSLQCYIYDAESNTWLTFTSMTYPHTKATSNHVDLTIF